jgi:hypothetical protein
MAGSFLGQLYARREAKLGVHVGEVGLHGAWRDEKPCGDVFVAESLADESDDVTFGRGERYPSACRAFAFATAALCIDDRLFGGQRGTFSPPVVKFLLSQCFPIGVGRAVVAGLVMWEAGLAIAQPIVESERQHHDACRE